jgi:CubicO group peptidase (beta-lactamase class C family)
MKLREKEKLRLDDRVGRYINDLHPAVAQVTIGQLLSHSAGIVRDGPDAGQFLDRRPFLNAKELRAQLKAAPAIEPNTRFKYSNHGYGLLGFIIEAVIGESYLSWIKREIVAAAGLEETIPDMPLAKGTPFAQGHSSKLPLGKRVIVPGKYCTHAIAPAGGFVSTARDLVRYFEQLSPKAKKKCAVGREPARDGPQAVERPAFEPRTLLRLLHHQWELARVGLVRAFRRASGIRLPDARFA